jgi:uncharacterized iron-regulated membrane protein
MSPRAFFVLAHRWIGLATAAFLVIVGLTGSLLAFWSALNHCLTPDLYPAPRPGIALDAATLARRAETLVPQGETQTVYLGYAGSVMIGMRARAGAAPLDFEYIHLDPITGAELGRVNWRRLPRSLNDVMPFIYELHMHLAMGGVGSWILGVVALAWTIDCLIAFALTLPKRIAPSSQGGRYLARWKTAWLVKWRASAFRINFDLHRASGLWLWGALLIFAWSSVYMDLNGFYSRAMRLVLDFEQPVWARTATPKAIAEKPISWEDAQAIARRLMAEEARTRGFMVERPLALYLKSDKGLFEYRVRSSRDIGDEYGKTSIFFDAYSGELRVVSLPTGQHVGNTLTSWLYELHKANLFGFPYKAFVCALGLVITMLSVTGVYIWWEKRRARVGRSRRRITADAGPTRGKNI